MDQDLQQFVTADFLVDELLGDTYDEGGVLKEKYYRWLFRIWNDLNIDFIRSSRKVILPISQDTQTVAIPPDYMDYNIVGYIDDCKNLIPLSINNNLAPRKGVEDKRIQTCPVCGQPDLCRTIGVEEIYEPVNLNETSHYRYITRLLKDDGSFIEETQEPTYDYSAGDPVLTWVKHTRTVCQLEKSACPACVPPTDPNLGLLVNCGCGNALCLCSNDDLAYQVSNTFPGSFRLYKEEGFIQMSPNTCLNSIYLDYVSSGLCKGPIAYFPIIAMSAMIEGAYNLSIMKKRGVDQSEKFRAERQATKQLKLLLRRLTRFNLQVIVEAFEQIPRIPSI